MSSASALPQKSGEDLALDERLQPQPLLRETIKVEVGSGKRYNVFSRVSVMAAQTVSRWLQTSHCNQQGYQHTAESGDESQGNQHTPESMTPDDVSQGNQHTGESAAPDDESQGKQQTRQTILE